MISMIDKQAFRAVLIFPSPSPRSKGRCVGDKFKIQSSELLCPIPTRTVWISISNDTPPNQRGRRSTLEGHAPGTKHPIHTQSCATLSEQLHALVSQERGIIKTLPSLQLKTRKEGRDARLAEAPS